MTTKTKAQPFGLTIRREVEAQTASDTLVSAFEGGTGYWCQIDNEEGPEYNAGTCDKIVAGKGWLLLRDQESGGKKYLLDRAKVARGLRVMAQQYPDHFRDMTSEDTSGDATTGDVLLQCCLFGGVIYG